MGDNKMVHEDIGVNVPLQYPGEDGSTKDDSPPIYKHPKIDFSSGWKDRGFAIAFWIHTIAVIIIGLVLGIPAVTAFVNHEEIKKLGFLSANITVRPYLYGLGAAAGAGGLSSFVTFFILQLCAGSLIKCSFALIITLEVGLGIGLFFIHWGFCFIPGFFLLITLICLTCIRKRISFAEAHLQAGCAAVRNHPSLILIALIMLVVEFLWFIFWLLMVLGIHHATVKPELTTNVNNTTPFNLTSTQPTFITTTDYMITKRRRNRTTTSSMYQTTKSLNDPRSFLDDFLKKMNKTEKSKSEQVWYKSYGHNLIGLCLLISWYWGALTIGNIAHFITACTVGQWWFTDDTNQQYAVGTSVKRALTTNFGTISFGSLFEAIIKAFRRTAEDNQSRSIFSCLCSCILRAIEKVVGYLNEWAFIFSALTGQSFVEAGKSFIELFRKRGWTAILNDVVIGITLLLINLLIGLVSAIVGGLVVFLLVPKSPEQIAAAIFVIILSFLIGVLMSSIITTILTSCVRTIFVCFALNPAALGATHPDHLQRLTKVWNKFYPQEFATSGYKYHLPEATA